MPDVLSRGCAQPRSIFLVPAFLLLRRQQHEWHFQTPFNRTFKNVRVFKGGTNFDQTIMASKKQET
jgi:hypothetical protein